EKVKVLDVGAVFAPTILVADSLGRPVPGIALTFTSRSSGVATVASDGKITARAPGDGWVVVTSVGLPDSIFVIVPGSTTTPVVRSPIATWQLRVGDTAFVNVVLDTRGATVGSGLFAVAVQTQPSVFSSILFSTPAGPPTPVVNNSTAGVLRVTV